MIKEKQYLDNLILFLLSKHKFGFHTNTFRFARKIFERQENIGSINFSKTLARIANDWLLKLCQQLKLEQYFQ